MTGMAQDGSASVAWIERSEIQGSVRREATPVPGFAALNPGYACSHMMPPSNHVQLLLRLE